MELALSLGDAPKPFSFLDKSAEIIGTDLGFCMAVGKVCANGEINGRNKEPGSYYEDRTRISSSDPVPVQLDLLPFSPVHRSQPSSNKSPIPWLTQNLVSEDGRRVEKSEEGPSLSSPNSAVSSFQMEFSASRNKRNYEELRGNSNGEGEAADRGGASSRGSDDEENGLARKKLRLTKEQSAFLEDTFKEHNTLNPKDKLALAKRLNLSTRQVEVWFQNRRARTKLKQTEVDCEYLKRCCETLREENRRMQKELQELRALKASKPFYMQLPATTLTMCPSCERVATTAVAVTAAVSKKPNNLFSLSTGEALARQAAS